MRGRRRQRCSGLSAKGLRIVLAIFCVLESLVLGRALAEGRPPQSWESVYQDAVYFYQVGDLQQALSHATRARQILAQMGTSPSDELAQTLSLEGVLLDRLGRHAESEPLHRRALKLREESLHPEDPRLAEALNNLAVAVDLLGRHAEAETLHKKALEIREKAFGPTHPQVAQSLNNLAKVQLALGRPADAGPLLRRAIAILSQGRGESLTRSQLDLADFSSNEREPDEGIAHVGKVGAAMPGPVPGIRPRPMISPDTADSSTADSSDLAHEARAGSAAFHEADIAITLLNLGMMAQTAYTGPKQGEAGLLYRRAIAIQEKVLGPEHPDLATSLNNLAELSLIQWHYREAEALHKRALAIREKALGPDHPLTAASLTNLARLYSLTRRPEMAEPLLARAVAISEQALGPDHPDTAFALRSLAMTHAALGNHALALDLHRRASRSIIAHALSFNQAVALDDGDAPQNRGRLNHHFQSHIAALHTSVETGVEDEAVAREESFELAQRLGDSAAARALTQMTARVARGPGQLAKLVRERQDLVLRWKDSDRRLLSALGVAVSDRDESLIRALREELAGLEKQIASISQHIDRAFPEYASLASPDPVPIKEAQRLLQENEALVQFLIGSYGSYVWVATKDHVRWIKLTAGRREIARKVDALRCGLDARGWYDYGSQCQRLLETGYSLSDYERGEPLPFDLAKAHELYRDLFGGIEDLIQDKHLLVVPSGPLTKLPLHVLLTAEPPMGDRGGAADYSTVPWLVRRQPITVLPSVTALKGLRTAATAQQPTRSFIGFGNPLLSGPDGQDRRAWQFQTCPREPATGIRQQLASAMQYIPVLSLLFRSSLADIRELRRQMPLPETADELCMIARRLGAPKEDVWLGERATERNLKHLNANGELAKYKVLHFATHGLVAGDLTGLAEPALILTPPDEASAEDDGLLTASEVAELDLAAEWVVLSACNTAAGQGGDAEALSGLARAFFHAGARALLVSHWGVNSHAAVKLAITAFAALADRRAFGRAEAMRQAMLSMIESGNPIEAHPSNWAPFVVVGEGSGG